jgi:hypothetical protein
MGVMLYRMLAVYRTATSWRIRFHPVRGALAIATRPAAPPPTARIATHTIHRGRALACAGYVSAGMVKMTEAVAEKGQQILFGASLDFRSCDVGDYPLRHAAVLAIVLGLEDRWVVRRAA